MGEEGGYIDFVVQHLLSTLLEYVVEVGLGKVGVDGGVETLGL